MKRFAVGLVLSLVLVSSAHAHGGGGNWTPAPTYHWWRLPWDDAPPSKWRCAAERAVMNYLHNFQSHSRWLGAHTLN